MHSRVAGSARIAANLGVLWLGATLTGCAQSAQFQVDSTVRLADLSGQWHQPLRNSDSKAVVLVFITNDCPISNGYAPEINRVVEQYTPQHISFYLVHVDGGIAIDEARRHAQEFGYRCPVLLDPHHELVAAVGATVTPEAAVIDQENRLIYRGRIDDRYIDFGKKRLQPGERDVREALDALIQERPVRRARTTAIGCPIPEPSR